jgi:hypothetical protein
MSISLYLEGIVFLESSIPVTEQPPNDETVSVASAKEKPQMTKLYRTPVGSVVKSGLKGFSRPTVHFASHVATDDSRYF